jgi:hypothetical protein
MTEGDLTDFKSKFNVIYYSGRDILGSHNSEYEWHTLRAVW